MKDKFGLSEKTINDIDAPAFTYWLIVKGYEEKGLVKKVTDAYDPDDTTSFGCTFYLPLINATIDILDTDGHHYCWMVITPDEGNWKYLTPVIDLKDLYNLLDKGEHDGRPELKIYG